ncbi:MAG TPA: sigma-70 family RNA polymerase sigma factor [Steroidobacteraceae bacterium]|jgi:RNA polymerase sigma-70 factor (ECF subfamily)|nr:sigma-70 family RNA polymerase sigma factor [Steroidobacteraceae bacterium]
MNPAEERPTEFDEKLQGLLGRCAAADADALQRLYVLVSPILFACVTRILRRRALAEEALQDVFISIWQQAGQFSAMRGRPMAWMMSIARYRAIDLLRRERYAPTLVAELPERRSIDVQSESEGGSAAWLPSSELMERCLALLSDMQARCLELAFVDGSSHEDIARLVGSPLGTVKSWIRRGLRSLRQCLES